METVEDRTVVVNPTEGVWAPGEEWRIVTDLRLGLLDGDSPEVFGSITDFAVSSRGEIAILDGQANQVRVFDHDGQYLRTFGQGGSGPGEFRGPMAVHFDEHGRNWVVDATAAAYHLFDADGSYLRSQSRPPGAAVVLGYPRVAGPDGFFDPTVRIAPDGHRHTLLMHVDTSGAVIDTLPPVVEVHRRASEPVPFVLYPFISRIISTPDEAGYTWLASTDEYRVYRRDLEGDTILEVSVSMGLARLSDEHEDTIRVGLERFHESPVAPRIERDAMELSPQFIRSLHPDNEGRLFVRPMLETFVGQNRVFDVFDPEGRYLGRVESDIDLEDQPFPLFRDGHVYASASDEMGVPLFIRGRIVSMPEN